MELKCEHCGKVTETLHPYGDQNFCQECYVTAAAEEWAMESYEDDDPDKNNHISYNGD